MNYIKYIRNIRILLLFGLTLSAQTLEEINQLRKAYDDKEKAKEASAIINQGLKSEDALKSDRVLLVDPPEILKYYEEKMKMIEKELIQLNRLLISTDSIPPLDYFGYNYFSFRDSIEFIDNANITSNYVLGHGDEIIISVWGQAEQYEIATINRDGTVFVNNVGLLYLGGKTISESKSYVKNRFSKIYSTITSNPPLTFFEFSIGKVKNINITVAGHVQFPGNYVVNPTIGLFNVLVLAGGINDSGTLRNIKIQREGSLIDSLDMYPLITGTGIVKSISLLDNDIIIIPPRGETGAITGEVLHPAYFELSKNNNIKSLLNYSGGITKNGGQDVVLSRLDSLNLYVHEHNFENIVLTNGDSLIVLTKQINFKSISVSVNNRSLLTIPWIQDLSFKNILNILNIHIDSIKEIELVRLNIDEGIFVQDEFNYNNENFNFKSSDHLSIHVLENFKQPSFIFIKGEVNSPGTYPLINQNESLNSIISRSGGLRLSGNIKSVTVKRDSLFFGSKDGNLILANKDTVIARPYLRPVMIKGEVHNPGMIVWSKNNRAKDYIRFAGGLTSNADKKHIILIAPYGEAIRISNRSNALVVPGSTIEVSEKQIINNEVEANRFQQISSIITSLVSIAILASTRN